jgi:regulator of RNase E activity RraA
MATEVHASGGADWEQAFQSFTTPEVSDALESLGFVGGLQGIRPAIPGERIFGPAFTIAKQVNTDPAYRQAADYIDQVPFGHVIVIDNMGLETCSCWGGILTLCAVKRGLKGTVINGLHRDIGELKASSYPVFSRGAFMVSGKGRTRLKALNVPLVIGGVSISPGDHLLGDDHGVVVIPRGLKAAVAQRVDEIRIVERQITHLVLEEGVSLSEARQRLKYNELTRAR